MIIEEGKKHLSKNERSFYTANFFKNSNILITYFYKN